MKTGQRAVLNANLTMPWPLGCGYSEAEKLEGATIRFPDADIERKIVRVIPRPATREVVLELEADDSFRLWL